MSIITEALKKAGKDRDKTTASERYLNKILGPVRKETYKRERIKTDEPRFQPEISQSSEGAGSPNISYTRNKTLVTTGTLLLITIIFLITANIFFVFTPEKELTAPQESSDFAEVSSEAEAYTDMKSELAMVENMSEMIKVFRGNLFQDEFLSNFALNGIIYDDEESWAIINNEVVRAGDTIDGAKVVSITPQKVVLLFENEKFDLSVK